MASKFFGCRIHFKKTGNDNVLYFKTIEEGDAFFEEKKKMFKSFPGSEAGTSVKIKTDKAGCYEDEYVVLTKEDIVLPF